MTQRALAMTQQNATTIMEMATNTQQWQNAFVGQVKKAFEEIIHYLNAIVGRMKMNKGKSMKRMEMG